MLFIVRSPLKNVYFGSYAFHRLLFVITLFIKEQKQATLGRSKELCLSIWAPIRADGASGATGYLLRVNRPEGGRLCVFGKRESEKENRCEGDRSTRIC